MRKIKISGILFLVLSLINFFYTKQQINNTNIVSTNSKTVKVIRIVDGDTIEIETGEKVRLIGINTPETVDARKSVECFGNEASNETTRLILNKNITLEKDISETDKYGRLLRYIYKDGEFINKTLVENGFAYATSYPPDIKYQHELTNAQKDAKQKKAGLWSHCPIDK